MVVNSPLIRPYFWGGGIGGVPLDSHDTNWDDPPSKGNCEPPRAQADGSRLRTLRGVSSVHPYC